ncbi:MAG: sensor histidine kinase [Firmicutes bacterium]|nr:sensor histidine kinase [Bacillota bacterium]
MGWIKECLTSRQTRLWLLAITPPTLTLLLTGMILTAVHRAHVEALLAKGVVPSAAQLSAAFASGYVLAAGVLLLLVLSTLSGLYANKLAVSPYWMVARVTRELAVGNYAARAELNRQGTRPYQELATGINILADALERTERLRRELVANLAHEIRTPLTNLQGYLEALRDGVIQPSEDALTSLHEEVMRLVRLVDALHQLSRADALRQQPLQFTLTDLDSTAERLARVNKPDADMRGMKLFLDLGARRMPVAVHADSVAQVMRNLLRNAVMYSDEGGTVRVQTAITQGAYRFVVMNTGPGIPPEDLPLIFNRFYRTDRAKQGAGGVGIGLAICKELVEAHGGRIGAESKGGWTSVWFELPADPGTRLDAPD